RVYGGVGMVLGRGWIACACWLGLVVAFAVAGVVGQHVLQLVVGGVLALAGHLTRRFTSPLALPALLVGGSIAVHIGLLIAGYSPNDARAAGWLMDLGGGIQWPGPALLGTIGTVDP